MIKKIKNILTAAALAFALLAPVAVPAAVSAQDIQENLKCGANLDANGNCNADVEGGTTSVNNLIRDVINIFSFIVGIVSVIMIIIGGFKYITSGGDSNNVSSAKNTILYAIIGLVIVAFAQFIVQFVLGRITAA